MALNEFVSGSSDEELLKSLPTENISEELVKAMNKAGLVQKDVQVTGKNGQVFTRKQWVKASDLKATDKAPAKQSTSEPDDANKESSKKVDASTLAEKSYKEVVQILDDAPVGTTITGLIDPGAQKRFGHNDDIRITKHSGYVANYSSGTKDKETWWEFNGEKKPDAAGDIVSTLKGTNKYYKARSKASDEGKPSTLTSTEVKDSSGTVIGTINAVTLKNGKTIFQAKGVNGRSDTYAFTDGGKKEAERFLKDSAKREPAKKRVIKNREDIDNGFKAVNRDFGKEKGIYNAIGATNGAYASADKASGFHTPITILVSKKVKPDDFLEQVKKEFGFTPIHKISSGNSPDSHLVTFDAEEFYHSSDDAHKLIADRGDSAKTNGAVKFDKTKSGKVGGIQIGKELATVVKTATGKKLKEVTDPDTSKVYEIFTDPSTNNPDGIVAVEKSETEKKGTTDKAAFEKIQGMKGYESQTGLVHGDYVYAEHDDDGDYNFTKMKRVDFEAGNSDEGTEMTPQQVLEDIKKPNIDHNTGISKPEKKEMLQDYFSGNHGHTNGKAALSALLGKGYSRDDIISEAAKQGVTWKKNEHEGINWMRASMAIQKHLGGGSSKTGGH